MESTIFKNTSRGRTSGILKGPITMVYAVGGIAIILLDKYLMPRIKTNKIIKLSENHDLQKNLYYFFKKFLHIPDKLPTLASGNKTKEKCICQTTGGGALTSYPSRRRLSP